MADLIDRQAVLREMLEPKYTWEDYDEMENLLGYIPAVDAVEVVRCGSPCRWLYDEPDDYCCVNHKGLVSITPDSFCSYGERREENAAD